MKRITTGMESFARGAPRRRSGTAAAAGAAGALVLALAGCAPGQGPVAGGEDALPVAMPDAAEGAALYEIHCAVCHGPDGRGRDRAAGIAAAPPDLTRIAARNGGTMPRIDVLSTLDGYTRAEKAPPGSRLEMPEFGALLEGDLVPVPLEDGTLSPVPRPLAALLAHLEAIQRD